MDIRIKKGYVSGTVCAPPSKSFGHRMIICAALAEGTSRIEHISPSEDVLATLRSAAALGAAADLEGGVCIVTGAALDGKRDLPPHSGPGESEPLPIFRCGESGSTLRFFIPAALALTKGGVFEGTPRLFERGVGVYEDIFIPRGIDMEKSEKGLTVRGELSGGVYKVRGDVSSQFISGLLFALPLTERDSEVWVTPPIESRPYIDITIDVMKTFGVNVCEPRPGTFTVKGSERYVSQNCAVEGDWSNGAALIAIGRLASRGKFSVTGLNEHSIQGDRVCGEYFDRIQNRKAGAIDISSCPDLGPVLFAFAAARGGAEFTGIRRLRIKESDRASVMGEVLESFGIHTVIGENDLRVLPGTLRKPKNPVSGFGDHRIVMAETVLMMLTGGVITGAEAVRKSYPEFFDDLRRCGAAAEEI